MKTSYNKKYEDPRYFDYKRWVFVPYVRALVMKYNVPKQTCILDVGCGTGFFSQLFYKEGMNVIGIDLSKVGVRRASEILYQSKAHFIVGDVNRVPFKETSFDLIFCRGLSLYNKEEFSIQTTLTVDLLKLLRQGGLFIFAWSTIGFLPTYQAGIGLARSIRT